MGIQFNGTEGSRTVIINETRILGHVIVNHTVNTCYDNISLGICFNINWSIPYSQLNWSDNDTRGGNFTWNFTEYNISPYNLSTYHLHCAPPGKNPHAVEAWGLTILLR